jgi:hypothetical protein
MSAGPHEVELRLLEADARYAHERAALYRARRWGGNRPTNDARMRVLDSAEKSTAARLRRARTEQGS